MSSASGYPAAGGASDSDGRPPVAACESMFSINVQSVTGDGFQLNVSGEWRVWDLMAEFQHRQPPDTPGSWHAVMEVSLIDPSKRLEELGLVDGDALTMVFKEAAADDVQRISEVYSNGDAQTMMMTSDLLIFNSLKDLRLTGHCRQLLQNIKNVALPSGLQSLTFGAFFNQSMEKVVLPSGLQSLTFGRNFNQSMEKVALPSGLQVTYYD